MQQNHGIEEPESHQKPVLLREKTEAMLEVSERVAQEGCKKLELGQVFLTALGPLYTVYLGPFLRQQRDAIVESVESRPS